MRTADGLNGLAHFAERAGYQWRETSDSIELLSGDPDFICSFEGEWIAVAKSERGEISRPLFRTRFLDELDRYLTFKLGNDVRSQLRMPRLRFNLSAVPGAYVDPGIAIVEEGDYISVFSKGEQRASFLNEADVSRFNLYARFSADEIRAAFLRSDGLPLTEEQVDAD